MRIYIDAGHGGSDPGAVAGGVREADVVLDYAKELQFALESRGHRVHMSRTEDVFPSLTARTTDANTLEVDCFVSVHANASNNTGANGFQVFYAAGSEQGRELADEILASAKEVTGVTRWTGAFADGTPHTGGRTLHVLRATRMPAVLVELGFLTHTEERVTLLGAGHITQLSHAIADGIEAWFGVELVADPEPPDPVVEIVNSGVHPTLPTRDLTPAHVTALLERPAVDAVTALAGPGDVFGDVLCKTIPLVMDAYGGRLPRWLPVALVRYALERLLRCSKTPS